MHALGQLLTWHALYKELHLAREAAGIPGASAGEVQQAIGRLAEASDREFQFVKAALERRGPARQAPVEVHGGAGGDPGPGAQNSLF